MNRTLAVALAAAAVVGTTGGALAAGRWLPSPDPGRPVAGAPSGTPSDSPTSSASGSPTGSPTGVPPREEPDPDDVLWANQRAIHDGDTVVDLQPGLLSPPTALHRTATGWLVTVSTTPGTPVIGQQEVYLVDTAGRLDELAEINGTGDVSPDGTRFVAMRDAGAFPYAVWDLASGERVEAVDHPLRPTQYAAGRALFADDGASILAAWYDDDERRSHEVVATRLGSGESRLVSADLVERTWGASAAGDVVAGVSRSSRTDLEGLEAVGVCVALVPTDEPGSPVEDCDHTLTIAPSFSADGSEVLAVTAYQDGPGPGAFSALDTTDGTEVGRVRVPTIGLDAAYLPDGRVVTLSPARLNGAGTRVRVCEVGGGCEPVGESDDDASTAVLGTTT